MQKPAKPPSPLRLAIRELQIALSLGVVAVLLHALITSTIFLHTSPAPVSSRLLRDILVALAGRGDMLLIGPGLCAGAVYAFGVRPLPACLGTVLTVELTSMFMVWTEGALDEGESPLSLLLPYWVMTAVAGAAAYLAGRWAQRQVQARPVEATAGTSTPVAQAAAADFAEQMRAAQEKARGATAPAGAAATAEASVPVPATTPTDPKG